MYFRIIRNIFNASTKISKQNIYDNAKFIFSMHLTVPKLSVCTDQYFIQNYSTNSEHLDKCISEEDLLNEKSVNDNECDLDEQHGKQDEINYQWNMQKRKNYFNEKDQEQLDAILKDNPEMQKLKKIIELELIVLQQDGERVPTKLDPQQWCEVLGLRSNSQRRKFYKYCFINEKLEERDKKYKEERRLELQQIREERKYATPSEGIQYGFADNFMLRRISNTYINQHLQWNLLRALMFGNKLVFDCSYDNYMSILEAKSCAKQLNESYAANRIHHYPFEIFLTNVNRNSKTIDTLHRYIPILYEPDFPFTITEKSYLELFDRSKLCYLSSNAPSVLEEYDPETIYIIGAFVDKGSKQPVSFSKAKREGIRMAKLPLDKYLHFGTSGGRDLTLNQMCSIMLDSQYKSWQEALKHVPTRKLHDSMIRTLENKINRAKRMFTDDEPHSYDSIKKSSNESFKSSHARFGSNEIFRSLNESSVSSSQNISSAGVQDFSHSARTKLRERWNK
ncbi:mitochondrial ribonuclease P protein 1 homolog [Phymastichus coffea]|uniref:mitochondrial ribonuclease P protein 1 homolog n=1 Tax=Phymastichus coffea TaxID=108790 RepID=UPI00273BD7C2|nr:mitochondrial ribonuclease P protein 1 homolog [Phymastichus coffea]